MQGPFDEALNEAMFRAARAKYVVTKDTGSAGGYADKIRAAQKVGAQAVQLYATGGELSPLEVTPQKLSQVRGWLADRGFDIIQTDFIYNSRLFLENTGRRNK